MKKFVEIKLFQVKPEKIVEFEHYVETLKIEQLKKKGCLSIKYMKRFYTIDGVDLGMPPREISKIVKCVKYYSYWEFDDKENYGVANGWLFKTHLKEIQKLLIAPFDIMLGYEL
jgi:hypothetical protein